MKTFLEKLIKYRTTFLVCFFTSFFVSLLLVLIIGALIDKPLCLVDGFICIVHPAWLDIILGQG